MARTITLKTKEKTKKKGQKKHSPQEPKITLKTKAKTQKKKAKRCTAHKNQRKERGSLSCDKIVGSSVTHSLSNLACMQIVRSRDLIVIIRGLKLT